MKKNIFEIIHCKPLKFGEQKISDLCSSYTPLQSLTNGSSEAIMVSNWSSVRAVRGPVFSGSSRQHSSGAPRIFFPLQKLQGISSRVAALHIVLVDHLVHVLKAPCRVCWEVWFGRPQNVEKSQVFSWDWNGGVSASSTRENRPNFGPKRKLHWLQLLVNFEVWHVRFLGKGSFFFKKKRTIVLKKHASERKLPSFISGYKISLHCWNKSGYIDTVQDSTGIRSDAVPRKGPIKIPSCLHLLSSWFKYVFLGCSWLPYNKENLIVDGGFSWWLMVDRDPTLAISGLC